jgi:hypothetical protein
MASMGKRNYKKYFFGEFFFLSEENFISRELNFILSSTYTNFSKYFIKKEF